MARTDESLGAGLDPEQGVPHGVEHAADTEHHNADGGPTVTCRDRAVTCHDRAANDRRDGEVAAVKGCVPDGPERVRQSVTVGPAVPEQPE